MNPDDVQPRALPFTGGPAAPAVVYRAGALGDFLLTLPLLQALSAQGRPVWLISRAEYRVLLPPECRGVRFMDLNHPAAVRLFAPPAESATDAPPWAGATFLGFMRLDAGMEENLTRHGIRRCVWIPPRPAGPEHASLAFLRAAGLPLPPHGRLPAPPLRSPHADTSKRAALWIHPGSGSPRKNAPPELLAGWARRWQERHRRRTPVRLSFGEADAAVRGPALAAFREAGVPVDVVDSPPLSVLLERLRTEARLFIGNDTGVTHLAGALGIPALAFFACTDPRVWRPLGRCRCIPAF